MILIGTVHTDLDGPKRLERILEKYKPRVITIETPNNISLTDFIYYEKRRINQCKDYVKNLELSENKRKLLLEILDNGHYEATITRDYAQLNNSEIYPVDIDESQVQELLDESMMKFGLISILLGSIAGSDLDTFKMLRRRYITSMANFYNSFYNEISTTHYSNPISYNNLQAEIIEDNFREQFMADKISRIKPDMHIGGYANIFHEYLFGYPVIPLHKRLGNKVKERIRLCDVDKF